MLRSGKVPTNGSSALVHSRALRSIQVLIDRTLSEVRVGASLVRPERIRLAELIEDIEITAVIDAGNRGLELTVAPVAWDLLVDADRHLLASAIGNLLHNAFKFTAAMGHVFLRVALAPERPDLVRIEVEDQCGGLPDGKVEELFRPYERGSRDTSGIGMGLSISRKSVEACGGTLSARGLPGRGCIFTVELPVASD
jgi:signal transduction histidine kinase